MSVSLREKCIDILDNHGKLIKIGFLPSAYKIASNLLYLGSSPRTLKEDLIRREFSGDVMLKNRKTPIKVTIISLGDASPRNARFLIVKIPRIDSNSVIDIAKKNL